MSTLYNLTGNLKELYAMLDDDNFDQQTVRDTIEFEEEEYDDKAVGIVKVILSLESDSKAIKEEEDRLKARRIRKENRAKWLKEYLFQSMKETGKTKIETPLFNIGIQKNGGKRKLVLDVEPEFLPHTLRVIKYEANNDAIREFLGNEDKCAFAHLEEQGESLRIR